MMMLRDLSIGRIDVGQCFPRYFSCIEEAFADRERELVVPYISRGRETVQRLAAVREAHRRYLERTGAHIRKLAGAADI